MLCLRWLDLFLHQSLIDKLFFVGTQHDKIADELGGIEFLPDFLHSGGKEAVAWPSNDEVLSILRFGLPVIDTKSKIDKC